MKGKGAHNVLQKVSLRVKDFDDIDDIVEQLDRQIDKAINEVAPKCKKYRKKQPWYNTTIKR